MAEQVWPSPQGPPSAAMTPSGTQQALGRLLPFELVHFKVMNQPNMIQRNTRAEREEWGRKGWTSTLECLPSARRLQGLLS